MTNDDILVPKSSKKFHCFKCDYVTSRKSQYTRHLLTAKHINNDVQLQINDKKVPKGSDKFVCYCGKEYKYRQGLYTHRKSCKSINEKLINENSINEKSINEKSINEKLINEKYKNINEEQLKKIQLNEEHLNDNEIKMLTNVVLDVIKHNKELTHQNKELTNKLFDFCKNNVPNTNINSHNKTFNLNLFLNEQCKDAMNIMDFVDSLKIQLSDLESVGKLGFVEGISNIIIKNLKALDIHKRPVHCSDSKRETIYIKDENKWEKEDDDKKKLRKAIKYIAHKNSNMLFLFKSKYPDCIYSNSNKSDQYNKLIIETMGGQGNNDIEKENKIIKNIAKETIISKM
jgi:hypothetical protein